MFDFKLWDGKGKKQAASVTNDNELLVIPSPYPPLNEQRVQPFRQYLTIDGTPGASNDMGVDGSATNVDFYISANGDKDRYITTLSFIVGYGTSSTPYLFADGAALTNGCNLFYENRRGSHDIHEGIKSNQDFFRLDFKSIDSNWQLRGVNSNNDYGYFITFDLTKMGLPFGIKLDAGSTQRLVMCIKDNVGATADSFNAIGYGFERF